MLQEFFLKLRHELGFEISNKCFYHVADPEIDGLVAVARFIFGGRVCIAGHRLDLRLKLGKGEPLDPKTLHQICK